MFGFRRRSSLLTKEKRLGGVRWAAKTRGEEEGGGGGGRQWMRNTNENEDDCRYRQLKEFPRTLKNGAVSSWERHSRDHRVPRRYSVGMGEGGRPDVPVFSCPSNRTCQTRSGIPAVVGEPCASPSWERWDGETAVDSSSVGDP